MFALSRRRPSASADGRRLRIPGRIFPRELRDVKGISHSGSWRGLSARNPLRRGLS